MQSTNIPPQILGTDETCATLGIKRSKLYDLISRGQLPSAKIGKKRVFLRSDVDAFVERVFGDEGAA